MKTCQVCGEMNPDSAKFCTKCGRELISQPVSPKSSIKWVPTYKVLPWAKVHNFTMLMFICASAFLLGILGLYEMGIISGSEIDYGDQAGICTCASVILIVISLIAKAFNKGSWKWTVFVNSLPVLYVLSIQFIWYFGEGWDYYEWSSHTRHYYTPPIMLYMIVGIILLIIVWKKLKDFHKAQEEYTRKYSMIEDSNSAERLVNQGGKIGMYNIKKMREILPTEYDDINRLGQPFYLLKKGNKYGLYNRDIQKIIATPQYDSITLQSNGTISVLQGEKKSILSFDGTVIN